MTPVLRYPDLPSRWGIAVERDEHHFRMIVPPLQGWAFLPRPYKISLILFTMVFALVLYAWSADPNGREMGALAPVLIWSTPVIAILAMSSGRLHRWLSFEVTADRLRYSARGGLLNWAKGDWARSDIVEIRFGHHRKMVLRIKGQESLHLFISSNEEITRYVVGQLTQAMGLSYTAAVDENLEPAGPEMPKPTMMQKSNAIFRLDMMLIILVGLLFIAPVVALILIGLLIVAAIPLGIWLGTQEKEFWQ